MNVKRGLCASALAAGIGLTGFLGTGITLANAAPLTAPAPLSGDHDTPDPEIPGVKLSHHDKHKLKKYLKEHPEVTLPDTGQQ